jgi:hypothetical protein
LDGSDVVIGSSGDCGILEVTFDHTFNQSMHKVSKIRRHLVDSLGQLEAVDVRKRESEKQRCRDMAALSMRYWHVAWQGAAKKGTSGPAMYGDFPNVADDIVVEEQAEPSGQYGHDVARNLDEAVPGAGDKGKFVWQKVHFNKISHTRRSSEFTFNDRRGQVKSSRRDDWEAGTYHQNAVWIFCGNKTCYSTPPGD